MGIPDHLTCLLRNLYADQEVTVRTEHETTDWFQIGRVHQGCILLPCLFNVYAEYIMRNSGLEEVQAGIKIAGRNIKNLMRETWVRSLGREDLLEKEMDKPGKSHGQRSLVGYRPWGRKEWDTTERLHFHFHFLCLHLQVLLKLS